MKLACLGRLDHSAEHVLGRGPALEEAPGALGEERRGNGPGADDPFGFQPRHTARFEVSHAILAQEAAQATGMAVLREADNLHMGLLGGPMGGGMTARGIISPFSKTEDGLRTLVFPCYSCAAAC